VDAAHQLRDQHPFLFASRETQNSPIKYAAQGIGDTILAANAWVLNPKKTHRGNASVGIGLLLPTGNDDVQNTVNSNTTGAGPAVEVTAPVAYSIQPGNGAYGMVVQWQGFRAVGNHLIFYTDGDYIASQGDTNGVQRATSTTTPLNNYVARSDQYLLEAGVSIPDRAGAWPRCPLRPQRRRRAGAKSFSQQQ
jgi:hypothetical protein